MNQLIRQMIGFTMLVTTMAGGAGTSPIAFGAEAGLKKIEKEQVREFENTNSKGFIGKLQHEIDKAILQPLEEISSSIDGLNFNI